MKNKTIKNKTIKNAIKNGDELVIALDKSELSEIDSSGIFVKLCKKIKNKKEFNEDVLLTVTVKSIDVKEIKEIISFKNVKVIETPDIEDEDEDDEYWKF